MLRRALIEDIAELINLGRLMHDEGEYKNLDYSKDKIEALLNHAIKSSNYFCWVYTKNNNVVGILLCYVSEYYFCDSLIASDLAFYIQKEYRGGLAAIKLVKEFIIWAKSKQVKEVCIASSLGLAPYKIIKLLTRLEFHCVGSVMKRRL